MNYIFLLYCQRDGLLNALLLGWKSADDCGKIANVNSTPACKWSFLLSLLYSSKDFKQVLRAIYYGIKHNNSVMCNIGVIFFMINLYTRFFEYFNFSNTHFSVLFSILGVSLWIIVIKAEKIFNISLIYNENQAAKESLRNFLIDQLCK
ncbi:hypothetical protein wVul_0024 [Wolbachia endosymbiont of Armadillidium vulgare str. wVulC]|nr:hypothetical protein wVul_0024 [Wolbachia endosymbiont of Armadillidium vulgare str. wVulC]